MFCNKCGNELNDTALFCPKCGNKIIKRINLTSHETNKEIEQTIMDKKSVDERSDLINRFKELVITIINQRNSKNYNNDLNNSQSSEKKVLGEYLFFNNMNPKTRVTLINVGKILGKVVNILCGLAVLGFVYNAVTANVQYKFIVYVIQFVNTFAPIELITLVIDEAVAMLQLNENKVKDQSKVNFIKIGEIAYAVLYLLACLMLMFPSASTQLQLLGVLIIGSFIDYLKAIDLVVIVVVGALILRFQVDKCLVEDKK